MRHQKQLKSDRCEQPSGNDTGDADTHALPKRFTVLPKSIHMLSSLPRENRTLLVVRCGSGLSGGTGQVPLLELKYFIQELVDGFGFFGQQRAEYS
ncbi:hypothetical protein D3C73_915310 [compost metagenome]